MIKIKHGFTGQRLVVYPFFVVEEALNNPLTSDLVVHSMGYFPKAENHFISRESGCGEHILIYCTKGEGWFILNGEKHVVPENHFFVLPAETPHQYGSSKDNPWFIYWVHFKGKKSEAIYEKLHGVLPIGIDGNSRINDRISYFDELLNVMESEITESTIIYVNLGFNHLISTFLYVPIYRLAKYSNTKAEKTFFISLATHYMYENIENKLTLKDLATYFGYSESYFYRLFFKEIQYAPVEYFNQLKIQRACQLLKSTNMKISQIALKLAFDDPYYFSRIFKKTVGLSPKAYRQSDYEWNSKLLPIK
ncbi:AraC family transcriptional regulator [Dysgonomonas sp. Marseille-P4677]|uniref:AraC family transcriptional regulator n=1 Tax=Dysgonomonas sp. Marseille-P4677 TaxID=2364790 RepID=UPI00191488AE|nr:AraC family transcriptional regulator [Dysgonomonas sp. Marseille-P4677]MBK5720845.1 AraC family transcriptional regulator [Dysgonomonas sp. Marseille-P4677]